MKDATLLIADVAVSDADASQVCIRTGIFALHQTEQP